MSICVSKHPCWNAYPKLGNDPFLISYDSDMRYFVERDPGEVSLNII